MYIQIPFDEEVLPFIIFILISALITTILFVQFVRKYRERKNVVVKYLMMMVLCWSAGTLAYSIGLISWYYIDDRTWLFDYSLPFGYSAIIISTYYVLKFSTEILNYRVNKWQKILKLYGFYMGLLIILFFLPQNKWGVLPPIPTFRMVNLLLLILGNIIIYSRLIHLFRNIRARAQDANEKRNLSLVLVFFLLLLNSFLLMVLNEIVLMFWQDPPPYGPIEYIAWGLAILGLIYGYIALIQPEWFKRRYLHEIPLESSMNCD